MKTTVILPTRNEENAIGGCIDEITAVMGGAGLDYELIVSDSSWDNSPNIAKKHGAKVIKHNREGYGSAILEAVKEAKGEYLLFADSDGSYDFNQIPVLIQGLDEGNDMVIGNRFAGTIEDGAMPWLHRYIGNPLLSYVFRLFFRANVSDVHCGIRAIKKKAFNRIDPKTTGMEFASEMVIKAVKRKLRIKEVPVNYRRRKGESKLRTFSDGWRHMRFMLLYSPIFLFFAPGVLLFGIGLATMTVLYAGVPEVLGLRFYYHPMFASSFLLVVGYELMVFSLFAKTYAVTHLGEVSRRLNQFHRYFTLERATAIGALTASLGVIFGAAIVVKWFSSSFGELYEIKNSIVALTLLVLGVQTVFSSFMLSILSIKEK